MPKALSIDLRERVIAALEAGASRRQAAERFGVGAASAIRWHAEFRQDGRVAPKPAAQARRRRPVLATRRSSRHLDPANVRGAPAGLPAGARHAAGAWGRNKHERLVALLRPPRHHAQNGAVHAAEQDRPDVRAAREAWFEGQLDPDRLVFIDETAAAANMARRFGRAPRGERCRIPVPHGHCKTTTVTAALRTSGLVATALFDGATNGTRFLSSVTGTLVPALKPGDMVVMDNLSAPKVAGVREAVEAVGARLLYLPSDSPDFNPIEAAFAKLKALLRTAAARTVADLWAAIRDAFGRFTPNECRNCLAAAGYDASDPT